MLRTGLITIAMIAALQGICFGQGFLDSILGHGGLGLWGGGDAASQQGPNQQPYQQPAASGQQQITYPPVGAQSQPQGYGYPQQGYSDQQQGVSRHPQNYPPGPIGGNQQSSATQAFSAPQQYQASQQSQAPRRYATPQAQAAPRQGFLNSILGPSGLGLWSGGDAASQQGPSQQPYQQPAASGQQQITYPPAGAQAHPQGHGYPKQEYSHQQRGVSGYPKDRPPPPLGGNPHYSATQGFSVPQQYQASQQSQAPQQYAAPPAQAAPGRAGRAASGQPLYRPRPYVPGQLSVTANDRRPGAVRITTTAPKGTGVQYYRAVDEPGAPHRTVQRAARQLKPKRAGAKAQSEKRSQPRENRINGAQTILDSLKL